MQKIPTGETSVLHISILLQAFYYLLLSQWLPEQIQSYLIISHLITAAALVKYSLILSQWLPELIQSYLIMSCLVTVAAHVNKSYFITMAEQVNTILSYHILYLY